MSNTTTTATPVTSPALIALATALANDPTNASLQAAMDALTATTPVTPVTPAPQPTSTAQPTATTHTQANAQLLSVLDRSVGALGLVEENRIINEMPIGIVRSWKRTMLATDAAFQVPVIAVAGLIRVTGFGFALMDGAESVGSIIKSVVKSWAFKYTSENNTVMSSVLEEALINNNINANSTQAQVEAVLNSVKDEVISSQSETINPEGNAVPNPDVVKESTKSKQAMLRADRVAQEKSDRAQVVAIGDQMADMMTFMKDMRSELNAIKSGTPIKAEPVTEPVVTEEPESNEPSMADVMVRMDAIMTRVNELETENNELKAELSHAYSAKDHEGDANTVI